MSESSVTSSQLDDIDLAVPAHKQYEPQADAPSPLYVARSPVDGSSLYSDSAPPPGLWAQTDQPRSLDERGHSPLPGSSMPGDRGGEMVASSNVVSMESPLHGRGRIMQDSGAAPDNSPAQGHSYVATSLPSSDASENVPAPLRDPVGNAAVTVDLMCPAFVLNEHTWQQASSTGMTPSEFVIQRVSSGFGVDRRALRFYQLKEVQQHEMHATGYYGVYIDRAGMLTRSPTWLLLMFILDSLVTPFGAVQASQCKTWRS